MGEVTALGKDDLRHLRWAGAGVLGAGTVLSRLPAGIGLPCPLRTLTGIPCPLCGMTTSVKETLAGDLAGALAVNPAGLVLVASLLYLLVVRPTAVRLPPVAAVLVAFPVLWIFELNRFGLL